MTAMQKLKYGGLIFFIGLTLTGCLEKGDGERAWLPFSIEGSIKGHVGEGIYLSAMDGGEFVTRDTAVISADGKFSFRGEIAEPDIFRVSLTEENAVLMVIDARHIQVHCLSDDLRRTCEVEGSPASVELQALMSLEDKFRREITRAEEGFLSARRAGETDSLIFFQEKFLDLKRARIDGLKQFIRRNQHSFTSAYATWALLEEADALFVDSMVAVFNKHIPESKYVRLLNERVQRNAIAVGATAPGITLPQPDGTAFSLSSLRGRIVLLDFWASWCRPCREENPNTVRLYERFKDDGFEILGISLDESKAQWIKAIEADQLPWRNVSDLKGVNSEVVQAYQVQAIPMTVLLDEEGRIIALNLRGASLTAKLEEVFAE